MSSGARRGGARTGWRDARRWWSLAAVVVLAVGVAACSDDDNADDDDGNGNGDTPELTGAPIRLMVIADGGEGELDAAERVGRAATVAAEAVNDAGGVQGSPIEIETCESGLGNANASAACARDAVDGGFAGVVGAFTTTGDSYVPVLEEAGIPTVAPFAISTAEFASDISFPIIGGSPATAAGMGAQVADAGAENINVSYLDVEQGALAVTLVEEGLRPRGLEVASETPVPPETPDLASVISAAQEGDTDGIVVLISETEAPRYIQQASELGVDVPIAVSSAAITPDDAETLGAAGEGVLVTGNFVPVSDEDNPGIRQFLDEREEYDSDLEIDDSGMNAWAGVHVVADVLADATGDVTTAATLIQALNGASDIDLGLIPPLSFDQTPPPLFGGAISRLFNQSVYYGVIEDGEIVAAEDGFVDPFVAPDGEGSE